MGDRLRTHQVLRSVSEEKTTKLGTGRFWVIDVVYSNQDEELVAVQSYTGSATGGGGRMTVAVMPVLLLGDVAVGDALPSCDYEVSATTVVLGGLATRDWRPMHHDKDFAVKRNGTQDIFLNTPEPGRVVRALPDRLDRAPRPAGPGHLPHEGLGLPGRHHGRCAESWSRPRSTTSAAASSPST